MKGHYIVFEGIDGSGKTSICSEISDSLIQRGYKVLQISEPSHSEIGLLLRNQMKNLHINQTSLALLYAADSYDLQEHIEDCYDFIISDRNYLSTVAYQMMAVDKDWLLMLHRFLKQPDMVFYLDVTVEAAMERIGSRNGSIDFFETSESLLKVKSNYEKLLSDGLGLKVFSIETVGKSQSVVAQNVMKIIQEQLSL
jgi:dTMP kinase